MMLPRVILPWAPRALWPNGQGGHWSRVHRARRAQSENAAKLFWAAGFHLHAGKFGAARIHLTYFHQPRGHGFDDDNCLASQKGALDALSSVLGINDKHFRFAEVQRGGPRKGGAVAIDVELLEASA